MVLPLLTWIVFAYAQGSQIPAQDAARMHAAELLLKEDIGRLVSEARSADLTVKSSAIWALGQTGDIKHLKMILAAAFAPGTEEVAEGALRSIGMPAYRAILQKALSGPPERRRSYASLLFRLATDTHGPQPNEARPLLWKLRTSENPQIRYLALSGLEYAHEATKVEGFASFLDDTSAANRRRAIQYLQGMRIDTPLANRLLKMSIEDEEAGVRAALLGAVVWFGAFNLYSLEDEQFAAVMHALRDEPRVAQGALEIVIRVAGPTGRSTAALIIEREPENAERMRRVLRVWNSDALRERVYALMTSTDRELRWEAALALAALRDPRAVELLTNWQTENSWERVKVLEALGWTDDPNAIGYLEAAATLPTMNEDEQAAIAKSFARLGYTERSDVIRALLSDKSARPHDRSDIAHAVEKPDAQFVDAVFSVIADVTDDQQVRGNLLANSPKFDKARAFDVAVWVLGRSEDRKIHWQAVAALEKSGDARAIPHIEKALQGADELLARVGERALKTLRGLAGRVPLS
ncbi:MAG: HEAT repeat domain-containing protein [Fimbriimonadales bacterium]